VYHDLISKKGRGLSANIAGISQAWIYFSIGNLVDWVVQLGPSWTKAAWTRGCGGALPACGMQALRLVSAH
jgi:hypothetical protein